MTLVGCGLHISPRRTFPCKSTSKHSKLALPGSAASRLCRITSAQAPPFGRGQEGLTEAARARAGTPKMVTLLLFLDIRKIRHRNSLQVFILMILTSRSGKPNQRCFPVHQDTPEKLPLPAHLDFRAVFPRLQRASVQRPKGRDE